MMTLLFFMIFVFFSESFCIQDTMTVSRSTLVTSDSAVIISPKMYQILDQNEVRYVLKPKCPVSSVILIVNYFPGNCDTLGQFTHPPFETTWYYQDITDQDQIHLQFGYILIHKNGDTIISPPFPHQWVLNHNSKSSKKKYFCRQALSAEDFIIDGKIEEWEKYQRHDLINGGGFQCAWTSADFFIAISVYDPFVSVFDRVELSFDLMKEQGEFFDINQRIISFGPQTRSFPWAVQLTDTGGVQVDSIIIRLKEEMEWRSMRTSFGYTIEARIPFCVLSALEFPRKYGGFDISVISASGQNHDIPEIFSWSGANPAERHKPSVWGTLVLKQLMAPLKLLLVIILIIVCTIIILMITIILYRRQKDAYYENLETKPLPKKLQKAIEVIEKRLDQPDLRSKDLAQETNCSIAEIEALFSQEMATSCAKMISVMRIKKAKHLLANTNYSLTRICVETGLKNPALFYESFKSMVGVSPQEWRQNRLEEVDEEEED